MATTAIDFEPILAPSKQIGRPVKRTIPELDGLRGLAILGVLVLHSFIALKPTMAEATYLHLEKIFEAGAFGVDLFFVISGFLITGILIDSRDSPRHFRNFYARRFLRLFPVYYGYLFFIAVLAPPLVRLFHSEVPSYHGSWWWFLLYICNWDFKTIVHLESSPYTLPHFWSLAIEEQFYLLWPAVVYFLSRRKLAWVCGAIIAGAFALRFGMILSHVDPYIVYESTPTRLDGLAFGALTALAVRSPRVMPLAARSSILIALAGALALVGIGWYAGGFRWPGAAMRLCGGTAAAIAFSGLVIRFSTAKFDASNRFLSAPLLQAYGKYSYSLYVYHPFFMGQFGFLAMKLTARSGRPEWYLPISIACVAASQVVIFGASHYSYRFIEGPILRLKERFR